MGLILIYADGGQPTLEVHHLTDNGGKHAMKAITMKI